MPIAVTDVFRDYHLKWNKSNGERQMPYDIISVSKLKQLFKWTYLQNRNRHRDIEDKFLVTKAQSWGRDELGGWD